MPPTSWLLIVMTAVPNVMMKNTPANTSVFCESGADARSMLICESGHMYRVYAISVTYKASAMEIIIGPQRSPVESEWQASVKYKSHIS